MISKLPFRRAKLKPQGDLEASSSYDIMGDVTVIRIPKSPADKLELTAERLMQRHRNVKTVLGQVGGVSGDLRLRRLKWIAGERKFETVHKEFGCAFKVDLKKCYFSPRLSYERMRIARLVKPNETVVNMFAGVGSFSILIACHSQARKIYSIDVNPVAVNLMRQNARLNRVEGRVVPVLGDAEDVVQEHFKNIADRVLMPLPRKALAYLHYALMALKPSGGWIHYYDFKHAYKDESPLEKAKEEVEKQLRKLGTRFKFSGQRVIRSTGPNWHQVVLDVRVISKTQSLQS
jgi:tRNA (guanine37-N1)-methyltransferase